MSLMCKLQLHVTGLTVINLSTHPQAKMSYFLSTFISTWSLETICRRFTDYLLWCRSAAAWRPSWTSWWEGSGRQIFPAGGDRGTPHNLWWLYRRNMDSTRKRNNLNQERHSNRKRAQTMIQDTPTDALTQIHTRLPNKHMKIWEGLLIVFP